MYTKHSLSDFSSYSVICAVDKFVKSVDKMNETVMVPSRLLDLEPSNSKDRVPNLLRSGSDSYSFYSHLNKVKRDLIWGISEAHDEEVEETERVVHDQPTWFVQSINGRVSEDDSTNASNYLSKGHIRKVSSVSNVSASSGISEHECERLSETADSGVYSEELDNMTDLTSSLKSHLSGVQDCLSRLTETADYIADKYKREFCAQ